MRTTRFHAFGAALVAFPMMMVSPAPADAQHGKEERKDAAAKVPIPPSIAAEHKEIMGTLTQATKESGPVGAAARELAAVLQPHFEREEQIALPPLGLLAALAAGASIPKDASSAALAMSRSLRAEMPKMLEEHKTIRGAVGKLGDAARAGKVAKYEAFAEKLALHARTEEEVLYPAAILVGDLLDGKRPAAAKGKA